MASNEIRIPVSAEIQADHKSLLAVQKALENTLALAGKDTTFATNLRKSLAEIEPLIEKFGRIVMEPEIDKNALRELEHIAKKVFGTFDKTVEQGRFLDVSKMLSDEDLARIQEYTKQVAALGRELEKVRQHGAGGAASEWLAKPEVTKGSDVAVRAAKSSIYKPAATLEQNVTSFTNAASAAAAKSADLAQKVVELTSAYETATKVTAQAQANLKTLEASVPAIQRRADTATFASAITRIKGTTSAAQNMQANTPIKEIGATLHQFGDAGYIQASYRNLATRFFQALGMGVEQATSLAASQIDRDIVPALQRHFGIDETNMRSYVVDNGPMLSQLREAGAIFGEILRNELAQARAAGMGSDVEGITDYAKKKQGELASARSAVKKARTAENEAFEEWAGAEEAQKQAQDLNIELTSLATALREAAAAAKTLKEAQLKTDQDAAKRSATDAEDKERERVMAPVKTHAPQAGKDEKVGDENRGNMGDLLLQGENAKAEADAFKASMQNAIKQWFSVQQIINIVKQGIRQAYQDIQGLDKAMTNIAVVTDMSVSDLWGKINEYMSIAQQYGVTTQGVYEVSQLYYQQGLSTNEVTAATTETLKLARIAGMGYAEAADAMTVAIRSFKMEMSDAAAVTDVYSKVAAITASDSEELAIAMSKTASSAESVGSSFENTTAMLAVMIETTRESAQNLGSALKSIISRYGEMKVGLTVDSEGEDIDYNKVDTALKSVGISIKDAQGQFRDFDDVIFELSEKWDSLDKNTQRYIATIMAGNRQQSRFIALVDNWERLDEVANAAQDSEDAGLLQYAKTLDSLETKLNNIKTSFQQFYMSIINGPVVSAALDGINSLIQGLNKLGTFQGIINIVNIIKGLKTGLKAIVNIFGNSCAQILSDWRNIQASWLNLARQSGYNRGLAEGQAYQEGLNDAQNGVNNVNKYNQNLNVTQQKGSWFNQRKQGDSSGKTSFQTNSWNGSKWGAIISIGGSVLGGLASAAGSATASENKKTGAWLSALGSAASGAATGASAGPWGALIGAVVGFATSVPTLVEAYNRLNTAREELENATKEAEESNLKRAQAQQESRDLQSTIENLKKLQAARYDSEEAEKAFIDAQNAAAEQFPQIVGYYDEVGNAVIDIIGETCLAEQALIDARKQAAQAALEAAASELDVANNEVTVVKLEAESDVNKAQKVKQNAGRHVVDSHSSMAQGGYSLLSMYDDKGGDQGLYWLPYMSSTYTKLMASYADGYLENKYGGQVFDAAKGQEKQLTAALLGFNYQVSSEYADKSLEEQIGKYAELLANMTPEIMMRNAELATGKSMTLEQATNLLELLRDDLTNQLHSSGLIANGETYQAYVPNTASNEAAIDKEKAEAQAAARRTAYAYANVYSQAQDPTWEANWRDVNGSNELILNYAMSQAGVTTGSFHTKGDNKGKFKDSNTQKIFQDRLNEAYTWFNDLTEEQINDLNELNKQASAGTISSSSYRTQVEDILGEGSELIDLYFDEYSYNKVEDIQRIFNGIGQLSPNHAKLFKQAQFVYNQDGKNKTFTELPDYYAWLDTLELEDSETQQQSYKDWINSEIEKLKQKALASQDYLAYFLLDGPTTIADEFYQAMQAEEDLRANSSSIKASQTAAARLQMLVNLYGEMGKRLNGEGIFAGLDDSAMTELYSIINTDRSSSEWARNVNEWAQRYGVALEDFETYVFENFNTKVQSVIDGSENAIKQYTDYASKQKSGFTFDEAEAITKQLGGDDALLTSWFEVTKDGLLVLQDFDGAMGMLYSERHQEIMELQRNVGQAQKVFNSGAGGLTSLFDEDTSAEDIEKILTISFGLDAELSATLTQLIKDGKLKTAEEVSNWLQAYYSDLGTIYTTEFNNIQTLIKEARKRQKVIDLQSSAKAAGVNYDKISAYSSLASKGLTGYSAEEIASLASAFNWKEGDNFILDTATGTYDIKADILSNAEFMSSVPLEYKNQLLSLIDQETTSALDAIKQLGASVAAGDKGVYGKAFDKTLGYKAAETLIPQWVKAAHEGRTIGSENAPQDPTQLLKEQIAAELSAETGTTIQATDTRVIQKYNELMDGYADGLDDNLIKFLELKEKELFGTISETERATLDNLNLDGTLKSELTNILSQAGSTTVDKYTAIMKAALASDADFEEVKQYIKDGYSAQLQHLATGVEDIPTLDAFDIMKNISEAEGQYTNDMLASMFSQVYAETGNEVDMSDFSEYFKIDPETKNWILKAGESVNDFLAEEYGGNVPEWITGAFSTSEAQKAVNDAIELDDLGTSATDTIGSMMSDLTNASLSDLVSLYESIYGEGSFADSGLLESYQKELEAAKRGETGALIAILQTLTQAAIDKGADVDTTQIQATVKDAHNTLISGLVTSINNGLSGTLSNIDFNNLIEQIGGAPEAYRKYVTETYDGLKLSAEGALVIASKLIDKFGNTSLVAESLVEQLGGSGALGSYEDVDNLINDIIIDTDHWANGNEEILKLLYQMRDEYSQLAEDAQFDFMNQDHFDGAADNWYTFTDNMSTAIDKLKAAFEKGGKIDYKSFDNIVTWISNLSVDGLDTQLGNTGKTLGEFADAVLATVDATGNLDLSAAAANLGISMDDMAGALENGLQEVAKQQVAYWKNYLKFLKGVKALQEASDEIIVEPPQINMEDGTYSYGDKSGLTADQAYSLWLADVYKNFEQLTITDYDGNTVQIFSGNSNPLQQLMSFKPELFDIDSKGDVQVKKGMASYVQQYMNQLSAWIQQEFASGDITKYIDQKTGTVKIPWNEVTQIELDTSVPPAGASNEQEAGEQIQAAAENSVAAALEASGAPLNGDGSYTYTLDGMTLKIQMGANGTVEIDLTNATGAMPTAAELRKVFEGQSGFSATDDNNWVFTDPNLGFSIVCANGAISFDTSGMTAPPIPTGVELSTILGTSWTTTDGGKTYTATLNGVTFVYNSASGLINIKASSFQLTGGLDATSLSTILGGTWTTKDQGATYTATIAGTSFVYESASGLVKIDGSKFTLAGGLSATELATILGGTWSSSDEGKTYESTINGVTFTYKSASGTVEIDSSTFTLSAGLSATQLNSILGGDWKGSEDGTTYTSVIGGVTFTYKSSTGTVEVDPTGFTVSANLTPEQLKTLLGGNWTSEDEGKTYTSTINGATFTYESTTGNINIDPKSFDVSANLTPEQLKTLLGGSWSSKDNIHYKSTINGVTFTYESTTGNIDVNPTSFIVSAKLTPEQLKTLLGDSWSSKDGITYKSTINGVTFTYESTAGNINIDPKSFEVSANLTPEQLKTLLGGSWSSDDNIHYKSTINGVTFTYESTTGNLVVTPPTTPIEPTNADFVTLMQTWGWTHENGVYNKDFVGGTLTYNATVGALTITPSATIAADNPDMAALLNSAFGVDGWRPNEENGGYDILNATTGEVLYTLPAKIIITPTEGSNVTSENDGLTADVDVTLTPNTNAIDDALSAYEGKTINLTIGISKNSSIKSSQHFGTAAAALFGTSDWDTLFNTKNWSFLDGSNQDLAEEAFGSLVTQASVLSNANQLTQEDVDLIIALGEAMEEAGINVSAAMETVSSLATVEDNMVLADLTTFAEAFGGANLFGNLTALTALLTAMTNSAAASLDLTGFITQLQSMGELELDDEEINNFVTAITALTTAITALPTEVDASVKVSAGSSYSVINDIKNALDSIKDKTVTITTKHVNSGTPTDANYAGNVSGLALAKGNATDKLLAGAHLAGKTLVGELGPELAVYNNQYHLLGRDGAEFVNLPNDAIVFNHRQTAGIIKGQVGYRGQALVSGNVTGPAAAGGIDAAISAVEKIIKLWSNIADATVEDLVGAGGGGGGGGSTAKAVTAELQEWYNLMRKIEYLTQEIANLESKRANILEKEGEAYLRNLRQTQALLEEQKFAQQILVEYQQAQLERQASHINEHSIWGRFLRIDENGLLQYIDGNEGNGGKGALDVLAKLNDMSAEQQQAYVMGLGYSATDKEGKALEGEELVQKFFEDFQAQIDEYDSLYDTVHQTEEEIQSLISEAAEIEKEILENQKELEEEIYDIIVEGFEKSIEELEEYTELVKEANEEYVKGLKDALDAEKDMYDQNKSVSDRESLQRQLSLLRRSGGSASEIADLEEQLNDALKDEYFSNQEKMIGNIEDANEEQVRKLEEQIRLQKEALEYQKENGIIWTEVYKVLDGTKAEILAFMQGNAPDFFSKSALAQEQALNDWSHKIGIFTEDRIYKSNFETADFGFENWDIWNSDSLKGLEETYNEATEEQQATGRKYFNQVYANALMEGATEAEAKEKASKALGEYLGRKFNDDGSYKDTGNIGQKPTISHEEGKWVYYGGYTKTLQFIGGKNCYADGLATAKSLAKGKGIEVERGNDWFRTGSSPIEAWRKLWRAVSAKHGELARYETEAEAKNAIKQRQIDLKLKRDKNLPMTLEDTLWEDATAKFYSTGGLVDYTGIAMVHGSKSKPEAFLNAAQTAQIKEALQATNGKKNLLEGLYSTVAQLRSLIHNISTINNSINNNITIAPGAVVINVDELANSYDVEELSNDIMNRMATIASKATNRGVSRR